MSSAPHSVSSLEDVKNYPSDLYDKSRIEKLTTNQLWSTHPFFANSDIGQIMSPGPHTTVPFGIKTEEHKLGLAEKVKAANAEYSLKQPVTSYHTW